MGAKRVSGVCVRVCNRKWGTKGAHSCRRDVNGWRTSLKRLLTT